nr:gasdermin-C isoform X1 [Callithrix jacchus]XP_035133070.2 gasdermin-C isoform X1 [Callithrix jacchus]
MSSMFHCISKSFVKEFGRNDLTPVECGYHAIKLRQFAVLQKTERPFLTFWKKYDYALLNFSLSDILESSPSVPDNDVNGPLHFCDTMIQKDEAAIDVNVGVKLGVSGGHSADQKVSLKFQVVTISDPKLEVFQKRKLLHPEPEYVKRCWKSRDNLYVVTDIVELTRDTVLYDYSSIDLILKISSWITGVKGEVLGSIFRKNEKVLTLKKGMVMAYKAKRLIFEEKDRTVRVTDDDERSICQYGDTLPIGGIEESCQQDFKCLQGEVSRNIEALAQLSRDVQGVVFSSILAMLRDRQNLQDLMYMLELDSSGHLHGPGGAILKILQQDSNHALSKSKEPILNLLEAIMVLSDIQHDLLAYSMKKRILLQQQEMVRSILEPNFRYSGSNPFTLKPELLAPLQREDLAITYGLLEGCGLRMELDSPKSTWVGAVKIPLSALYETLSLLQQLAEA